jgi:hypothetical protein
MTCENRTEASQRAFSRRVPSLSVTLAIGITSRPTFDPAQLDMLEPTRDMRHDRTSPVAYRVGERFRGNAP